MQKENLFNIKKYSFNLPPFLIAQQPKEPADSCRLLIVDRKSRSFKEVVFKDIINFLEKDEILVLNNTKVIPAKLIAKKQTGAKIEVLLVKEIDSYSWEALVRPAKRLKLNDVLIFDKELTAQNIGITKYGGRVLRFSTSNLIQFLKKVGKAPLPHYIKKDINDLNKYQTIYAKKEGAIAAPTAGFHFTTN
ncbi:MAG: S-adenosylmethionine:tRNA ribosyltransferase-isomerase, partial [Candidatus Omnitrophica bacterium]|nr:S-adenosylmethionine:tRNA ribosyltransferase-isomerase [Candidatus Omnitrophota bacterium]